MASGSQNDGEQCKPRCPYNCPYAPSKEEREEVEDVVDATDIEEGDLDPVAMTIIRNSDHKADVHFQNVWDTKYGPKMGITSKQEFSDIFGNLDWEVAHHKWNSPRTEGTNMWEADLEALMYIAFHFVREGIDVTFDDQVRKNYLLKEEGLPLNFTG